MAEVRIANLTRKFGGVTAVDGINLTIADGEFLTLLGPSGCGKSTTLAAIAGLDRPTGGSITVGDTVYVDAATGRYLPPEARNCGLVFQSYALWPHMTVFDNCAFPLKLRKVPESERKSRVAEVLGLVEMETMADRYPNQLSGGQQQRVALARTLVYRPTILLLDEPLSNLDAKLRERARVWLAQITKKVGLTTVYVTHDQSEALALSDRIAVMQSGRIAQLGTPRQIYQEPANSFVADFIGSSNFLAGTAAPGCVTLTGGHRIDVAHRFAPGQPVTVAVRPERLSFGASGLPARITERTYLGARWLLHLAIGDASIRVETPEELPGDQVFVQIPPDACVVFPGDDKPS